MKLYEVLLCIYLLMKPYYIFSSGGLQIGDIILTIAFVFYLLKNRKSSIIKDTVKRNQKFILFVFFLFLMAFIILHTINLNLLFQVYTMYLIYS